MRWKDSIHAKCPPGSKGIRPPSAERATTRAATTLVRAGAGGTARIHRAARAAQARGGARRLDRLRNAAPELWPALAARRGLEGGDVGSGRSWRLTCANGCHGDRGTQHVGAHRRPSSRSVTAEMLWSPPSSAASSSRRRSTSSRLLPDSLSDELAEPERLQPGRWPRRAYRGAESGSSSFGAPPGPRPPRGAL